MVFVSEVVVAFVAEGVLGVFVADVLVVVCVGIVLGFLFSWQSD